MNLPHTETSDPGWSQKALDMFREGLLHGQARAAPEQVVVTHVWGYCPRCKHALDVLQTHLPDSEGASREKAVPVRGGNFPVSVTCACGAGAHPGAWAAAGGCGATFEIAVPFIDPSRF